MSAAADSVVTTLTWPWVAVAVVVVVAAVGALGWYLARRPEPEAEEDVVWVANSEFVGHIPRLSAWVRRYRALQWAGVGALAVAVVATSMVAARPAEVRTTSGKLATRDIVLCLDVSGSMIEYDQQMVDVFSELVDNFQGERIALSIFNSTSRTVFPLTDDYTLVRQQLEVAKAALDPALLTTTDDLDMFDRYLLFTAGTMGEADGSSLIGDGLASCALVFDEAGTDRSRSIVLATDNALLGNPIYTLDQAAALASSRDITVNGLYGAAPGESKDSAQVSEYRTAIESTGGLYFFSNDPKAVDAMVQDVLAQQAVDLGAEPEIVRTDKAGPWFLVATLGVAALVLVQWRLRE